MSVDSEKPVDPETLAKRLGSSVSRRSLLGAGLGGLAGIAAVGAGGLELVAHGVLPGKTFLDRIDGACEVPGPPLVLAPTGPSLNGSFYSTARRRGGGRSSSRQQRT